MTHSPDLPTPSDDAPAPALRPYQAPDLTLLGTVDVLTSGPNSGNIDQIYGGSGGFQDTAS